MNAQNISTILFDLDGTLVDHFQALYLSYVYAHEKLGVEPPSYDFVKSQVGASAPVTMERIIGKDLTPEALEHFNKHFEEVMFEGLVVLPGAFPLLEQLRKKNKQLAIFTNKTGTIARTICEYLKLSPYMDIIAGVGDTKWRKPEPEFSNYVLEKLEAKAEDSILVGDSPYDLQTAHAINLRCYLVSTGTHSVDDLSSQVPPANGVYSDLSDLGKNMFKL